MEFTLPFHTPLGFIFLQSNKQKFHPVARKFKHVCSIHIISDQWDFVFSPEFCQHRTGKDVAFISHFPCVTKGTVTFCHWSKCPCQLTLKWSPLQGTPEFSPCVQVKVYRRSLCVLHLKTAPDSRLPVIRACLRPLSQHAALP